MEKKLYRVEEGKVISGLCGGVAQYFNLDPSVVRLAWIIFSAMGGTGVVAYVIGSIVVPKEP